MKVWSGNLNSMRPADSARHLVRNYRPVALGRGLHQDATSANPSFAERERQPRPECGACGSQSAGQLSSSADNHYPQVEYRLELASQNSRFGSRCPRVERKIPLPEIYAAEFPVIDECTSQSGDDLCSTRPVPPRPRFQSSHYCCKWY